MANRAHLIAGPMLYSHDKKSGAKRKIATAAEIETALSFPKAIVHQVVAQEWINEAMRKAGYPGKSEIVGRLFRRAQRHPKRPAPPTWFETRQRGNWLQRVARRITRIFRK